MRNNSTTFLDQSPSPFLPPSRTSVIQSLSHPSPLLSFSPASREMDIIQKIVHVPSILEDPWIVGIRGWRGGQRVAGGAFSTVRAQEAITLDACRPPLLLSLRGTSCRVAKYRIPPALSPPCRCLGGEESRPPPLRLSRRKLKPSLRSPGLKAVIMRGIGLNIFSSLFFSARGERRGRENFFFSCVSRLYFRRGIYNDFFNSEKESLEKVALYNVLEGG